MDGHYSINEMNEKIRDLEERAAQLNLTGLEAINAELRRINDKLAGLQRQIDRLKGVHGA